MKPRPSAITGIVQDIFAHRFTLRTAEGVVLADLTPHGQDKIDLSVGDQVTIEGERKPSEIRVERIQRGDLKVTIDPPGKHDHDGEGDPEAAIAAARAEGFEVIGEARRKPRHFEILGRRDGSLSELHVSFEGDLRHAKPIPWDDDKWRAEIARTH